MTYLKWLDRGWRYNDGVVTAYFADGGVIDIPVGKARKGAFYLKQLGEDSWEIAPVRFPKIRPESYDGFGHYQGFLHLSGADHATNELLSKI